KPSAGQAALDPVQFSATSQGPAEARQTVLEDWKPSAGQAALDPVQCSAGSHSPAEARQTVVEGSKAIGGEAVSVPVQVSSTSQTPAAARQTAPALPAGCWQASCVPSHSSRLQGLPSSVHAVPAGSFASPGQVALDPVQCSAGSHSPAEARQAVVEGSKALAGQAVLVPVQVSATSQTPAAKRHTVPALPSRCSHAPALQLSVVQGLPSAVQSVPFGWKAVGGQAELAGTSAMSWLIWGVLVLGGPDCVAFEPLAPGLACNASALSEDASVVVPPELALSTLNRSVMPAGAPTALLSERPKQPTSIVL